MKNNKSKQKSLRRQWSMDVPSSIQKKFREVTRRSKSLDEDVHKQRLLDETGYDRLNNKQSNGSYENFGHVNTEQPRLSCSSGSSPWYSFEEDSSDGSLRENEAQSQTEINDIQIEVRSCEVFEHASLPIRTTDILSVNTSCGLLSTIDELTPRSPNKRTSPVAEFDINKDKPGVTDVPRKFAKNENTTTAGEDPGDEMEPEIGERYRRYAICEEMERYIIVDHKGRSLRKYRETLIRHRVLQELCLL